MDNQKTHLPNNIKFVPQGELLLTNDSNSFQDLFMSDEYRNYSANRLQEQLLSTAKVTDYSNIIITKEEQDKHLTDRMDNTNKLLEDSNQKISELQLNLEESYAQLLQANDKIDTQTSVIEGLKTDLKIETFKREAVESKLSGKDWKVAFIGFACAIIVLAIEHWRFVLNLILSLFE